MFPKTFLVVVKYSCTLHCTAVHYTVHYTLQSIVHTVHCKSFKGGKLVVVHSTVNVCHELFKSMAFLIGNMSIKACYSKSFPMNKHFPLK